ncbi:hypothetical protein Tco_0745357 [Tanacetum coccineum]
MSIIQLFKVKVKSGVLLIKKEIEYDGQHEKKDVKGEIEIAKAALIQQEIELGLWSWDNLNSEGDVVEGVLGVGGDGSNSLKTVDRLSKSDEVRSDNVVRGFKDVKSLLSKRISVCNIVSDNDDMVVDGNNSKVCVADRMVFDPKKSIESATKGKYVKFKNGIVGEKKMSAQKPSVPTKKGKHKGKGQIADTRKAIADCHKVVSDILADGKSDDVESCDVKKGKSLLSKRERVYNVVSDDDDTVADDNKVYVANHVVNDKKKSIKHATKGKAIAGCDKVFSDVVADADNYVKPVDSTVKCDKVSFDLGGTFVTDADVEVPEALKLFLITFVRNINVIPNSQGDVWRLRCYTEYSSFMSIKVFPYGLHPWSSSHVTVIYMSESGSSGPSPTVDLVPVYESDAFEHAPLSPDNSPLYPEHAPLSNNQYMIFSFDPGGAILTDVEVEVHEVGIPQASFDPIVVFVTDIQLEVLEVSESYVLKLFRNLNVTPNTHGDFYHLGKILKCHPEYMAPVDRLQSMIHLNQLVALQKAVDVDDTIDLQNSEDLLALEKAADVDDTIDLQNFDFQNDDFFDEFVSDLSPIYMNTLQVSPLDDLSNEIGETINVVDLTSEEKDITNEGKTEDVSNIAKVNEDQDPKMAESFINVVRKKMKYTVALLDTVKVLRRWCYREPSMEVTHRHFEKIVLDEKGDKIHVIVRNGRLSYLNEYFREDMVVLMQKMLDYIISYEVKDKFLVNVENARVFYYGKDKREVMEEDKQAVVLDVNFVKIADTVKPEVNADVNDAVQLD